MASTRACHSCQPARQAHGLAAPDQVQQVLWARLVSTLGTNCLVSRSGRVEHRRDGVQIPQLPMRPHLAGRRVGIFPSSAVLHVLPILGTHLLLHPWIQGGDI